MIGPGRLRMIAGVASLVLMTISWAFEVQACVVCIPYPTTTHTDLLLKSDTVVLARENPAEPYSFAIVRVLKGMATDRPIKLLLGSKTRRSLSLHPEHGVVLYRGNTESDWELLAYADPEYQKFISYVLAHADAWRANGGARERVAYFSQLLRSSHRTIRKQAYLEVGQAPYNRIRQISDAVPREEIRAFLADWRLIEWHRLYILMLGNSSHPEDRAYIREQFEGAARYGISRNLSAWTVAFIEANPESAIEEIEDLYFRRTGRAQDELEAVAQGLSVVTTDSNVLPVPRIGNFRRRIARSYETLVDQYPEMAGFVARDLMTWKRRALVDPLSRIAADNNTLDPGSAMAVASYLSLAPQFPSLGARN